MMELLTRLLLPLEYDGAIILPALAAACFLLLLLLLLLLTMLFWLRPHRVDHTLPGPKRHWLLGVTFADDDFSELIPNKEAATFDDYWARWPTLSMILSQQYHYQTWGGPTLNLGKLIYITLCCCCC